MIVNLAPISYKDIPEEILNNKNINLKMKNNLEGLDSEYMWTLEPVGSLRSSVLKEMIKLLQFYDIPQRSYQYSERTYSVVTQKYNEFMNGVYFERNDKTQPVEVSYHIDEVSKDFKVFKASCKYLYDDPLFGLVPRLYKGHRTAEIDAYHKRLKIKMLDI